MSWLIPLHVLLAVFVIGPMALLPHTGLRALRIGDAVQARSLARSVNVLTLLSLLVFVLGFGALAAAPKSYGFSFGQLWVWLSVILYLGAFALSFFVVVPNLKAGAAEVETAVPDEKGRTKRPAAYAAVAATAGVTTILLVVVVILMAWRPGA